MPRETYRLAVAALMALVTLVETAGAKDAVTRANRGPSSLSALSVNGAKKRDFRRIGDRHLPSGGQTEALLSDESATRSPQSSSKLAAPRITLPQERSMPRQGTLSPQYNYTDVNIQFR